MRDNFCWGCGADNPDGLHLESSWRGDVAVARWQPRAAFAAGPRHVLNGGIIATLLDCHGVCTAIADAYARESRDIGSAPDLWYATASISVDYARPTPLDGLVDLAGHVVDVDERLTVVSCTLVADGKDRAHATVRAVRVPETWRHGAAAS